MKNYLFDVKLFAVMGVDAETEEEARARIKAMFDCCTIEVEEETSPDYTIYHSAEASIDGEPDLVEVDGEAV